MNTEAKILQLFANHRGTWMEHPEDWVWVTPALEPQGFGLAWREHVGLSNLLWLSLDMERPPCHQYNARYNELYTLLAMYGNKMELDGQPLLNQAEALTLAQFRNLCCCARFAVPAPYPNIAQLLVLLANKRLIHAHT